jgi:tight adherence protein B
MIAVRTLAARTVQATATAAPGMPLWLVCGLAFLAFLIVALVLFNPLAGTGRAAKQARLAEVGRYRILGAVGRAEETVAAAPAERVLTARALALLDRVMRARGQRMRLVTKLERTGLRMRPEEWAALQLSAVVGLAATFAFLLSSPAGLVLGGLLGWGACRAFVARKIKRHAAAFEANLPDALALLAGALRSGFTLNQAIGSVVREGTRPTAEEFGRALTEVRLGAELEDALDGLATRLRCYDLSLVVMAIRTSREVGGNLAEVLQITAMTMRERSQLRQQVKVLSAEGRISAKVLIALPLVMAAYLLVFKRGYLNPLVNTGVGIVLFAGGGLLLGIGSFWLSRLVKIEV